MREDLLQPSLGTAAAPEPLYSVRALFLVSFFGGPLAAIAFSALNALRLRRLPQDLPIYGMAAAALAIGIAWLASADSAAAARAGLAERRNWGLLSRGLGLLLCGAFYYRHRAFHRSATLLGLDAPRPWIPGLICVFAGGILFNLLRLAIGGTLPE